MDYKDTIDKVLSWYNKGIEIQQTELDILNKRTIIDYKNDMTRRLNGDISHLNLDIENPISFPIVRKVLKSYISKVASNPVEMVVKSYNVNSGIYNKNVADSIKTLLEWANATSNQKKAFTLKAFQVAAEGTVVEFEGFHDVRVKRKVFDSIDDKGKVITKDEEHILERGCYTSIRNLEDILISNPFEEDIQKQAWIIDREIVEYEVAKKYYLIFLFQIIVKRQLKIISRKSINESSSLCERLTAKDKARLRLLLTHVFSALHCVTFWKYTVKSVTPSGP
jgi:hypothetical protein